MGDDSALLTSFIPCVYEEMSFSATGQETLIYTHMPLFYLLIVCIYTFANSKINGYKSFNIFHFK